MVSVDEARSLAEQLLVDELPRRFLHVRGVARQAERLASVTSDDDRLLLVAAAWLHDIGYASGLVDTGFHPIDGARFLRRGEADERVVNLVAHHSCVLIEADLRGVAGVLRDEFPRNTALPHDELCYCDQTTSPDGDVVDVSERLAEIRRRYPDGHVVRRFVDVAEAELTEIVRRVEDAQPRYGSVRPSR
jgi:putative nucleotidyltransferase with HDIG domain